MGDTPEKARHEVAEKPKTKTLSEFGILIDDKPKAEIGGTAPKLSDFIDPAETKAAQALAKSKLGASEREVQKDYDGQFFKISDLLGKESGQVQSEFHVTVPDMNDEKFKGKKPRVICWFHQNGGQKYDNVHSRKIYDEVARLRAAGDPVVLLMPRDNDIRGGRGGNWGAMQNPQAFSKMIEHAEKLTGRRLGADITLASSSGGYLGIAGVLKNLNEQRSSNPRAEALYKGIKQIGLCDSLYGQEEVFAQWYADNPSKKIMHAYGGTSSVHRHTEVLRKRIVELLKENGEAVGPTLDINPQKQSQIGHDVDPAHVSRFIKRVPGDSDYLDKSASKGITTKDPETASTTAGTTASDTSIPIDLPSEKGSSAPTAPRTSTASMAVESPVRSSGGGGRGSVAPTAPGETTPAAPAETTEQVETVKKAKHFVLGDPLFEGLDSGFSGLEYKKIPLGESVSTMVKTLKENILNQEVKGSTLVVLGGMNDLFESDSIDGAKHELNLVYKLAKDAGMKVIAATLPPPGYSKNARDWAAKKGLPYEEYNKKLIERWSELNEWIANGEGKDGEVRPDSVVRLDKQLEDPKIPGKLRPEFYVSSIGFPPNSKDEMSRLLREEMDKGESAATL